MVEYENSALTNRKFIAAFKAAFNDTLHSGNFILGKNVIAFENAFRDYCRSKYCVGVASGLDALFLSLKALNLKRNDEVIVPSNTYMATILAVVNAGLKPVLAEPDIYTYNIDPKQVELSITPRTRVILPVHLYGKLSEMPAIKNIADRHQLYIIEDCAQSHGAKYKNQMAGTFGDIGAYSFYPTKNLGALGDAGGIITKNKLFAEKIKRMRNYGSEQKYYNKEIGYNSRLDEVQAAFLAIKLKALDDIISHKRKLAQLYLTHLNKAFTLPVINKNYFDVYHIFAIRHPQRDKLKAFLQRKGIQTEIHYPIPPYKQACFKEMFAKLHFPIEDEIHSTILSLPIAYFHSEKNILQVIKAINQF